MKTDKPHKSYYTFRKYKGIIVMLIAPFLYWLDSKTQILDLEPKFYFSMFLVITFFYASSIPKPIPEEMVNQGERNFYFESISNIRQQLKK